MDCFNILEIEKTTDIKKIKKAYSRLLKKYHPEEYPDEYMKIHKAYQQAMNYAKNGAEKPHFYYDASINSNESFVDTKLEQKFQQVEEYEKEYFNKLNHIDQIMQQIKDYQRRLEIPPDSFFESDEFMKYYKDNDFIDRYIDLIVNGIYLGINVLERKKLIKIHDRLYFSNESDKKEYELLYDVLYPYLYSRSNLNKGFLALVLTIIFVAIEIFLLAMSFKVNIGILKILSSILLYGLMIFTLIKNRKNNNTKIKMNYTLLVIAFWYMIYLLIVNLI